MKQQSLKANFLCIALAYFFSVGMRLVYLIHMGGDTETFFSGTHIIISPDGFAYATAAKELLDPSLPHISRYLHTPIAVFTAFLTKVLPWNLDTIIFYLPAFLSSLIVIPSFLITKLFIRSNLVAFGSAILTGIVISYFRRTSLGYFDTDMLTVVFPMFTYLFIFLALRKRSILYAVVALVSMSLNTIWYPSSVALNAMIITTLLAYLLLFERKRLGRNVLLGVMAVLVLGVVSIVTLFGFEHISAMIASKMAYYLHHGEYVKNNLHFINSASHVVESSSIGFFEFAYRTSGNLSVFILSFFGYIILVLKRREALLFLPMIALGILGVGIPGYLESAGSRFVIYLSPVFILSFIYMAIVLNAIGKSVIHRNLHLEYILFALAFYVNFSYALQYSPPSVETKSSTAILTQLGKESKKDAVVISWWDYGYGINYYANRKTVCDGGMQVGSVLYPISYLLMQSDATASATMVKLLSELTRYSRSVNYLSEISKHYKTNGVKDLLEEVGNHKIVVRDYPQTYLSFPKKMMEIYGTINTFYNTDPVTGHKTKQDRYLYISKLKKFDLNKDIVLGAGVFYVASKQQIFYKKQNGFKNISKIISVDFLKDGRPVLRIEYTKHSNGYIIISIKGEYLLVVDKKAFDSMAIQMGVLGQYDPDLFEPVVLTKGYKIYRVKK